MKSISAGFDTHLSGEVTTLATCWKVTRVDGTVFGFTDHDKDLVIPAGSPTGVTYAASTGYTRSAIQTNAALQVDNLDLEGAFASSAMTEADLRAGLWDYAAVEIFMVNWADVTQTMKLRKGRLGNVRAGRNAFSAELRGLMQHLQQTVGRIVGPLCDADLGDTRCKVRVDPPAWAALTPYTVRSASDANTGSVVKHASAPTRHFKCTSSEVSPPGASGGSAPAWNTTIGGTTNDGSVVWTAIRALTFTGTVTAVTSNSVFSDSAMTDPPDDWFTGGEITFTSGLNAGLSREVKRHVAGSPPIAQFTLQQSFPFTVAVSDAFSVVAGCQKRRITDCQTKFDNIYNHRGFDLLPGMDKIMAGGLPLA